MSENITRKQLPIKESIKTLTKVSNDMKQSCHDLINSKVQECIDETVYFALSNQMIDSLKGLNLCLETLIQIQKDSQDVSHRSLKLVEDTK